jgi:hypothetical protein
MRVNLTVKITSRQGFKTPVSQLKSSKEDWPIDLWVISFLSPFQWTCAISQGF